VTEPRIRVVVYLEPRALEDLELLVRYGRGPHTRSAIVREAIDWLRAKEAAWLLGYRRQAERRQRERDELDAARKLPREDRDRNDRERVIAQAVAIVRAEAD
jgi:hypothetical protein